MAPASRRGESFTLSRVPELPVDLGYATVGVEVPLSTFGVGSRSDRCGDTARFLPQSADPSFAGETVAVAKGCRENRRKFTLAGRTKP